MRRDTSEPLYVISVAAKLVEMHPQTLRMYERLGLIKPARTDNNIRLYSDVDIERFRQIQRLTSVGLNLAGVEMVLDLLERMERMRRELAEEMERREEEMEREIERLREQVTAAAGD
ncbi:MAG TPA: MerR family transcriptional regulator [Armatimonadota bacterium]|nr:MerR family transcriptional regulator [Armatimonadota bacterium]